MKDVFRGRFFDQLRGRPKEKRLEIETAKVWINRYPELRYLFETNPLERPFVSDNLTIGEKLLEEQGVDVRSRRVMEFDRTIMSLWVLDLVLEDNQDIAYTTLTSQQTGKNKLLRPTYNEFVKRTRIAVSVNGDPKQLDPEKVEVLRTGIVLGDLGKSKQFAETATALTKKKYIDHDKSLAGVFIEPSVTDAHIASLLPSFAHLNERQQTMLRNIFLTNFHSPQLQQAEIRPKQAEGLTSLTPEEINLCWAMGTLDIAGAQGNQNQQGSLTLMQPVVETSLTILDTMHAINQVGPEEGIKLFYRAQAEKFGLDIEDEQQLMLTQLATMFRYHNAEQALELGSIFNKMLTPDTQAVWQHELTRTGYEPEGGIMIYYLPILLIRCANKLMDRVDKQLAIAATLSLGADLFRTARQAQRETDTVFVLMANDIVGAIESDPERVFKGTFAAEFTTDGNEAWAHVVKGSE